MHSSALAWQVWHSNLFRVQDITATTFLRRGQPIMLKRRSCDEIGRSRVGDDPRKPPGSGDHLSMAAECRRDATTPRVPSDRDCGDVESVPRWAGRGNEKAYKGHGQHRQAATGEKPQALQQERSVQLVPVPRRKADQHARKPTVDFRDERVLEARRVPGLGPQLREHLTRTLGRPGDRSVSGRRCVEDERRRGVLGPGWPDACLSGARCDRVGYTLLQACLKFAVLEFQGRDLPLIDFPLFRTFRLKLGQLLALRFEGFPGIPGGDDGSYQEPPGRHIAPVQNRHIGDIIAARAIL